MTPAQPSRLSAPLSCPACEWEWQDAPRPALTVGDHPAPPGDVISVVWHKCTNGRCRRHFFIVYRLSIARPLRLRLVAIVRSLGRDAGSIRASLEAVIELPPNVIEWYVSLLTANVES